MDYENVQKIYDVIIIGAGPAGIAAAIYARRARLDCIVLESQPMGGGQILNTYEVDNYPGLPGIGGFELGERFQEHADKLGVTFEEGEVTAVENKESGYEVQTGAKSYNTRAVILATGAAHRRLGVEGEQRLTGMGVSYCATCDGAFFRNKTAAVVGGGDVAVEDAVFLSRICEKVYVIHRRDTFRAAKVLQETLLSIDNVEVIWDSVVDEICGEELVDTISVTNVRTKEKREITVQGVFIAVGIVPNSASFSALAETDENGYFIAGEDCRTSSAGVYAVGDVRTKALRQVITAAADGANAVASLQEDLLRGIDK